MKWQLLKTGRCSGHFNMDFDLNLANSCKDNEAFFRLYQWQPYCISLGANQNYEDINIAKANNDNIEVVKRPTGGRAILHAEEITYSVVMPLNNLSPKEIYEKISSALIKGLEIYNSLLAESELEKLQPNFPNILKQPSGVLCFGSTAKNEVKFAGKKIIGSAQRKLNNVILQHGSILCGTYHKKLVNYLNSDEETIRALASEINNKTIEIETILNEKVDYTKLEESLIKGFEDHWQINFVNNT
ncbi:MAG: lipoate--protein ligase family protein [Ignavibacteria bacterium]|nr:lipoate--protein ligase family protein [Ignavibacteria bacterium]